MRALPHLPYSIWPSPPPPLPRGLPTSTAASPRFYKTYPDELSKHPPPVLIFRGQPNLSGHWLAAREREAESYPPELVVLWQPKAWVDRPTACDSVRRSFKVSIDRDFEAGVADESSRYLMIEDNLDAQMASHNPDYTNYLSTECQADDHKVPAGKTDQVHVWLS